MHGSVTFTTDFTKLWQEGMKEWDGSLSERMRDDQKEEAFWQGFMPKKELHVEPEPYVFKLQQELLDLLSPSDEVLEIGPGWGNYTFSTARKVKALTCIDSSRSVLSFLDDAARARSIQNLLLHHGKWETYEAIRPYDVVFGVNCYYRMYDIEAALKKMNEAAKRLAIIGMTSGPEQPHYYDLRNELGYQIKFKRRDYIYLTNILYGMGIDVNCKIIPLVKRYTYDSFEELVKANTNRILDPHYDLQAVEAILKRYIQLDEGKYIYDHHFKAALLYWIPTK